jgi:hypothetical protein
VQIFAECYGFDVVYNGFVIYRFFSHNISESPEDSVKLLSEEAVPADRVTSAFECLPPTSAHSEGTSSGFLHWTIRDYNEAYRSGQLTPTQVSQFLKPLLFSDCIWKLFCLYARTKKFKQPMRSELAQTTKGCSKVVPRSWTLKLLNLNN